MRNVRLRRSVSFGLLLPLLAPWAPSNAQQSDAGKATVSAVIGVAIPVSDLDQSVAFFTKILQFEVESRPQVAAGAGTVSSNPQSAWLRLGDERIELVKGNAASKPVPADSRGNDRWFQHIAIVVSDMDRAYDVLLKHHVRAASTSPQRLPDWNPNAGGVRAFYFRDPDGHFLELIQFPAGKGDKKWQRHSDQLFLGIDHTAIVVSDTEASLRFYRDSLGMQVAGASENYGPEQEALNNVPMAHLRITALRAASGPGIEFLEYLEPHGGREYPSGASPNDLIAWQTLLAAPRVESNHRELRDPDGHFISISQVDSACRATATK